MDSLPINLVVYFDVFTHDPDTGNIHDADSVPTFDVFKDGSSTPILAAQTTTKRTGYTGDYMGTMTLSVANGFAVGSSFNIASIGIVTGSVSGSPITAKKLAMQFRCVPAESVSGVPLVDVKAILGTALTETAGQLAGGFKKFFNIATPASTMDALTLVATATALTTNNDKTGYALTSSERNATADALLDRAAGVETGFTLRQALRLVLSSVVAKLSGAATTSVAIRDINDTKDRITATVDANGNRTSVSTDVT